MGMLTTLGAVKSYLNLPTSDVKWDNLLAGDGVNLIQAASAKFERMTNRQFSLSSNAETRYFSTEGQSDLFIGDLMLSPAPTVTLLGNVLPASTPGSSLGGGYSLIPDIRDRNTASHIQIRSFGIGQYDAWYKAFSNWFDANLDRWPFESSIPLDLAVSGTWGHNPVPDGVEFACRVLTAWYFKRKDAIPGNLIYNADGSTSDMHDWPVEVLDAIRDWRTRSWVTSVR